VCDVFTGAIACVLAYEVRMTRHVKEDHGFVPRRCPYPGCTDTTVFDKKAALGYHIGAVHNGLPTVCWVCNLDTKGPPILRAHIKREHPEVTKEELDKAFPRQKRMAHKADLFSPQRCTFPGCKDPLRVWQTFRTYKGHLRSTHKVSTEDRPKYILPKGSDEDKLTSPRSSGRRCCLVGVVPVVKAIPVVGVVLPVGVVSAVGLFQPWGCSCGLVYSRGRGC
jgi:hypothetical protein